MSVDLLEADCLFAATAQATSLEVAQYLAEVALLYEQKGYEQLDIFLDRNPTHKTKMQDLFSELTNHLKIKTHFHFIAAYSPQLNLVEYVIHLIRQKELHHADCKLRLADFEERIKTLCKQHDFLTKDNIINILAHIESLILNL